MSGEAASISTVQPRTIADGEQQLRLSPGEASCPNHTHCRPAGAAQGGTRPTKRLRVVSTRLKPLQKEPSLVIPAPTAAEVIATGVRLSDDVSNGKEAVPIPAYGPAGQPPPGDFVYTHRSVWLCPQPTQPSGGCKGGDGSHCCPCAEGAPMTFCELDLVFDAARLGADPPLPSPQEMQTELVRLLGGGGGAQITGVCATIQMHHTDGSVSDASDTPCTARGTLCPDPPPNLAPI